MKKFFNILVALIILTCNAAYAEPKIQENQIKQSQIEVKANVPEKFDKKIYVNFTLEDGTTTVYTLTSANKYRQDGVIKVGNAKVNFIKIVGNDDNKYDYLCDDSVDVKEGENSIFKIQITSKEKDDSVNESKDSNNSTINKNEDTMKSNVNADKNISTDESKKETIEDSGFSFNELIKRNIATIIIIPIGLIAYAIISRKNGGDW